MAALGAVSIALAYIAVHDECSALVDLADLVLTIAMHVNRHAVAAASQIIARASVHIDAHVVGIHAETIADESVASAQYDMEVLPARLVKGDEFACKAFLTFDRIGPRIDDDGLGLAFGRGQVAGS